MDISTIICIFMGIIAMLMSVYWAMLETHLDRIEKKIGEKKQERAITIAQGQKKGKWLSVPSTNGDRDFIWWKCSECGLRIFSESLHDRKEKQRYCSRFGAVMWE